MPVRNVSAVFAFLVALFALGVLAASAYAARERPDVSWLQAAVSVPVAALLAFFALALATRARQVHQRTLGRIGGERVARAARGLGMLTLVVVASATVALAVFAVLLTTEGLTTAPW